MKLSDTLNKTIADFCQNNLTGTVENHCAHFVCHVLELDAGYDCKTHKNGSHPGACLRVQELFPECPQVGNWNNAPQGMKIVFVTDKSNVDLTAHTMRNVPRKHVGIFSDRKSTRLNSSHGYISYAVFCLKKKKKKKYKKIKEINNNKKQYKS